MLISTHSLCTTTSFHDLLTLYSKVKMQQNSAHLHITHVQLSNCCLERHQTLFHGIFGLQKVQTSTQLTIRHTMHECVYHTDIDSVDELNKNLCGRDGRTICGPLRVPKSTYVTLAHKRKPKFFYFGCSLVRRCNCKQSTSANGTDGQTDGQTDRQSATQYAAPS